MYNHHAFHLFLYTSSLPSPGCTNKPISQLYINYICIPINTSIHLKSTQTIAELQSLNCFAHSTQVPFSVANAIRSAFFVLPPPSPASCWLREPFEICWRQQNNNNNNNNWEENSIVATFAASLVMRNLAEWKGGRGSRGGTEADERGMGDGGVWRGLPSFSHLAGHSNATWPINYATAWHMQPVPSATPIRTETRTIVTATYKRRAPPRPLPFAIPVPLLSETRRSTVHRQLTWVYAAHT